MQKNEQIRENVYRDTREKLLHMLGESFKDVDSEQLIDYAVENVLKSVRGQYNMADVNLAVQRSIAHHLDLTGYAGLSVNSLAQSILEETTDYNWLDLTDAQLALIYERTEGI